MKTKKTVLSGIAALLMGLCICACIPVIAAPEQNASVPCEELTICNDNEHLLVKILV